MSCNLQIEQTEPTDNLDSDVSPVSRFRRFQGRLWVPIAGTYTFKLSANTQARLFVGSNNIINSTGNSIWLSVNNKPAHFLFGCTS